jgi:hypothetical protein
MYNLVKELDEEPCCLCAEMAAGVVSVVVIFS